LRGGNWQKRDLVEGFNVFGLGMVGERREIVGAVTMVWRL